MAKHADRLDGAESGLLVGVESLDLVADRELLDDGDGPLEAAGVCFEGAGVAGHAGFALLVPHPLAVISVACARRPEAMTDATSGVGACVGDGHAQVASIISIFGIIYTEERLKWLATDAVQRAEGGQPLEQKGAVDLGRVGVHVGRGGAGVVFVEDVFRRTISLSDDGAYSRVTELARWVLGGV